MLFAASNLHISISAQEIFSIGGFPVTNAFLTSVIGTVLVLGIFVYVALCLRFKKYNRFVGLVQWAFEGLLRQINDIIPDKHIARRITPLAMTIFFFVLLNYWFSIIRGLDSITWNGVPVLRSVAADLNFTFGLAIITIITVQLYAIKQLGVWHNAGRYFKNPIKDPIGAFEGFLELIGELSRGTALSLRLFGNAFAGEVLLLVIAILTSYFAAVTLPFFLAFELFIGVIQAYVFFVLTLIFTALAVNHGPETDHSAKVKPKKAAVLE